MLGKTFWCSNAVNAINNTGLRIADQDGQSIDRPTAGGGAWL
jgi:hypothetical protein